MEGTVIGTYRVVRKLGEGGMGAVYLAEHTLLGRMAAVKVLQPSLSRNQDIVQRFFNEARASTAIADPGIVQIFDFGYHTDGSAYIVMEFLDGEALDSRIKRLGRMEPVDALRILRQVASSLGAAHARGIIHRDLKPENIYLVHDREVSHGERPKLLDFGIAKLTGDTESKIKTHTAAIMGTPMYMSPEQCRGAGHVDHRSDLYSLGCVLYQMLVGRTPFDGEGVGDIIAMHLREPAPAPSAAVPGIPPEVDAMVLRLMAKDPDQRYGSAPELAEAIGFLIGVTSPAMAAMPSGGYPAVRGAPTTLSGSAGNLRGPAMTGPGSLPGAQPARKSRTGLVAGIVAGVAIASAVAVVVASGGGGSKSSGAAQQPAPSEVAPAPTEVAPAPTEVAPAPKDQPAPPEVAPAPPALPAGSEPGSVVADPSTPGAGSGSAPGAGAGSVTPPPGPGSAVAPVEVAGPGRRGRKSRTTEVATKVSPVPTTTTTVKPPPARVPGDTDGDGIPDSR